MSKRAVLKLDGRLEEGFRVTLEVGEEGSLHFAEEDGHLLPAPELIQCLEDWQQSYPFIEGMRIKLENITVRPGAATQAEDCRQKAKKLQRQLKAWLTSGSFHVIDTQLREAVNRDELIRVVLRCQDRRLHLLPWHTWDFIDRYHAEVAFSLPTRKSEQTSKSLKTRKKVRVLAILGDSDGINTKVDRTLLETLPDAEVVFLVEPLRQQLNEQLWEQPWDILFFAGHSQTEDCAGRIYINANDSLTIDDLRFALKRAIAGGLQLAIFNSCDGLGLVYELEQLGIPQLVVMRQPVPDLVAQEFLKHLLTGLVDGQRFYSAVREAREKLQSLEDRYPCASWLPVIFQNPNQPSLAWQDLHYNPKRNLTGKLPLQVAPPKKYRLSIAILIGLGIVSLLMGVRSLGWLEPTELWAYDRLTQLQSSNQPSSQLLLVLADEADTKRFGDPLSDQVIYEVLKKIQTYQPAVIGLDIFRHSPVGSPKDWQQLARYLEQSKNLILICQVGEIDDVIQPAPAKPSTPLFPVDRLGYADSFLYDSDDVTRRYVLAMGIRAESSCNTQWSFGAQVVQHHLKTAMSYDDQKHSLIIPIKHPSEQTSNLLIPLLSRTTGGYQQPSGEMTDAQLLIRYQQPATLAQQISISSLLEGDDRDLKQLIHSDRIVLIGYKDSPEDTHFTPLGNSSGVMIHAQVINQLLRIVEHQQAVIWSLPEWSEIAILFCLGVISSWFTWWIKRPLIYLVVAIETILIVIIGVVSFGTGLWLPVLPLIAIAVLTGVAIAVWKNKTLLRVVQSKLR